MRFLSSPKDTAFLTSEPSVNKGILKVNIYFNCERIRGMRIKKGDRVKFVCFEILNGLAADKGLLGTAISCHDIKTKRDNI